jgi:hypothetical protein
VTVRLRPPPEVLWRCAITEHQKGDERRLVNLVRAGGEVPPFAREYLAGVISQSVRRGRGRPVRRLTLQDVTADFLLWQDYQRALIFARLDDAPGTPSERALEALAVKHGTSAKTLERRLQRWRTDSYSGNSRR